MSRLFGVMCNDPERLACALHPTRDALVVPGAPDGWGLAFFQGGEVLLQRHPKPVAGPLDFFQTVRELRTDYLVGHVREPGTQPKLENTQPYRFRSWVFAAAGPTPVLGDGGPARILEQVPDFLRRNIRGQNDAELVFHVFLSFLHDGGKLDDPNMRVGDAASALSATIAVVDKLGGGDPARIDVIATNGRIMLALRRGKPMYTRQTNGITDCRLCREANPADGRQERRRFNHEHVRATLILGEPDKIANDWEEVPEGTIVTVARDLTTGKIPIQK
jgi:glutamine amidotransferase